MAEHDYVALDWVKGEIDSILLQARESLEEYVNNPEDSTRLRFCLTHIHQVQGTLNIVEFFGAALLAEEMEKLIQAMMNDKVSNMREALEILMQAIIQLPAYLDRVRSGRRDIPVILLPLFNDLRSVRGEKLLTESSLFSPNLQIVKQPVQPEVMTALLSRADFEQTIRKLRQNYQMALVKVLRDKELVVGLSQIAKIFATLNDIFKNTPLSYLWWVGQGLIEGISNGAITSNLTIKWLLRLFDKELKNILDRGASIAAQPLSDELFKNLLFYIARTTVDSLLLRSIKNTFDLESALLNDGEITQERHSLAGPDKDAMISVVNLLVEEIGRIKDSLDLFVRSNIKDKQLLKDVLVILKQLSDTLVILSLGDLRHSVQTQTQFLQNIIDTDQIPTDKQLFEMAEVLVYLEGTLTDLVETGAPSLPIVKESESEKIDFTPVEKTVVLEARNGLEQVRVSVVEFVASQWNHEQINDTPELLASISGGLTIIPLERAARIISSCSHYVRIIATNKLIPKWQHLDTLADAIAGVEYYLERLIEDGHTKSNAILDIAEQSMEQLGYPAHKAEVIHKTDELPAVKEKPAAKKAHPAAADDTVDEEVIEIFIEEAGDVQAAILEHFPTWKADTNNNAALTEFRRAFHTLKGSGRMVGAVQLGELAWSIESMLNRVLDKTIEPNENVVELVETVISILPPLVESFHKQEATTFPIDALIVRGQALGKGESVTGRAIDLLTSTNTATAAINENQSKPLSPEIPVENKGEVDELMQIFCAESEEHLCTIDEFIKTAKQESTLVNDALQRALHTLKGSSNMANVLPVAEIIAPLDKIVRSLWAQKIPADVIFISLLEKGAELVHIVLAQSKTAEPRRPEQVDDYLKATSHLVAELIAHEEGSSSEKVESNASPKELAEFLSNALNKLTDATNILDAWSADALSDGFRSDLVADLSYISAIAKKVELNPIYELSDALMSLYENAVLPDAEFFHVTKQAHEELINLMDFVAIGQAIPSAHEWIAVLKDAKSVYVTDQEESTETPLTTTVVDEQSINQENADAHEEESTMSDETDPELIAIFLEEAGDIQESISDSLEKWIHEPEDPTHVKQLQRDLHTLKGGARMSGITPLGDFCHQLENLYEGLSDGRLRANDQLFVLLEKCHDRIASMIESITKSGGCDAADDLLDAIKNYGKATPTKDESKKSEKLKTPEVAESKKITTKESAQEIIEAEPASSQSENYDPELVAIFLEEANDIMESIGSVYDRWRADPDSVIEVAHLQRDLHTLKGGARMAGVRSLGDFCHHLESLYEGLAASRFAPSAHLFKLLEKCHDRVAVMLDSVGTRGHCQSADDLVQAIKAYCANPSVDYALLSQADNVTTESVEPAADVEAMDPEVINIFMGEAESLVETIDHCIHEWRESPTDLKILDELQRAMHTLKGGARLAGLTHLGNLSHDFETYLNNVRHQGIPFDKAFFAGLLKRQDEIVARLAQITHPKEEKPVPSKTTSEQTSADILTFVARKDSGTPKETIPERRTEPREPKESVKVGSELLESLVNLAGETSIARGRIEQGVLDFIGSLGEMESTILRVKNQLLALDTETQAQITSRHTQLGGREYEDFDPLEMDRYSTMQQLSRSLIETASDLLDLKDTLNNKARDTETLLLQQARINTELQEGLMRTRMVPFSGMVPRLRRIVRQVSAELNKQVEFEVINAEGEMDRTVLERMVAPLEHMLRNAVDHGIEMPKDRKSNKKPEAGLIQLKFGRAGGDVVLELSDDGGGINIDAVRAKAIKLGLLDPKSDIPDQEVLQFIMHAGFSTAQKVTQISGRGVGMDVVNSEIKQLGGTMRIQSVRGVGTRFTVHLPFTVSVNRALMVRLGEDMYAVPLNTMRGVVRMNSYQLETYYQPSAPLFEYGGEKYRVQYLGSLLDRNQPPKIPQGSNSIPLILVPHETQPTALQIDGLMGSREIVVKTVGPQFGGVSGLSGATILGDGNVVVILDFQSLIFANMIEKTVETAKPIETVKPTETAKSIETVKEEIKIPDVTTDENGERQILVMVVDDSVTVRKVTTRVLERYGMQVVTAKDGVDALKQLEDVMPDIMLLDIEMPRMDGFEVATEVRQNPRLKHLPIIMITSRTGDKHRDRARAIGVNRYMGKPFQEAVLLETIKELVSTDE